MNDGFAAFLLGFGLGCMLAGFGGLAIDHSYKSAAAPLCASLTAYPIGNSGPYVICEGVDSAGARVLTVVVVK